RPQRHRAAVPIAENHLVPCRRLRSVRQPSAPRPPERRNAALAGPDPRRFCHFLLCHPLVKKPRRGSQPARAHQAGAHSLAERLAVRAADRRELLHGSARCLRCVARGRACGNRSRQCREAFPGVRLQARGGCMSPNEVPVLIVGGGGAGLTASMLLSQLGVETLLVSALPTTSVLPKAHVLNQRTMEIFTDVGVADKIYRRGTPPEHMRYSAYYAGFAGPDPVYGRQLGRMESWGAGG